MSESLAVKTLRRRMRQIAFDANLYDRGMVTEDMMPHAKAYSNERKRLLKEIERLSQPVQLGMFREQ